jgi:hypothetical protein
VKKVSKKSFVTDARRTGRGGEFGVEEVMAVMVRLNVVHGFNPPTPMHSKRFDNNHF